ncbi:DsbA family protein [Buchnera aphidicola (Taiwanaphis decaspermi)]|uniref:DsbA family protein n=1 Tax=Buchnera aphidicola TaxID=9 RepID=UPI0031B83CC7
MRKIIIFIFGMFLSSKIYSCQFIENKDYNVINNKVEYMPKITKFFSFLCPYCYQEEIKFHINDLLQKKMKEKYMINKYHVNFLGNELGKNLTHMWCIAQLLGIENKILLPMFEGVQKYHTINNKEKIKQLFIKVTGIGEKDYDKLWNSFSVKMLMEKEEKSLKDTKIQNIPTMVIKGKYIINNYEIKANSINEFIEKYYSLIKFLIKK